MNENIKIGSHVRTRQDNYGIVSQVGRDSGLMTIGGGGLTPSGRNITVVFAAYISELPEDLLILTSDDLASTEEIAQALQMAQAKQAASRATQAAKRASADNRAEQFIAEFESRRPVWAKAVIVAELQQDDSDIMTDYFASHTSRTVILAFSKHTRDLFSEMRKAAATFQETAHLGPRCGHFTVQVVFAHDCHDNGSYYHSGGPSHWHSDVSTDQVFNSRADALAWIDQAPELNSITFDSGAVNFDWSINERDLEHREKYSMGSGYYLLDGFSNSSGWKVSKINLKYFGRCSDGEFLNAA